MTKDKTAMQEMIDLLELDEELKKVSPYLINIIKDVYIKKEKEKIIAFGYNQIGEIDSELGEIIYKKLPEEIYKDTFGDVI